MDAGFVEYEGGSFSLPWGVCRLDWVRWRRVFDVRGEDLLFFVGASVVVGCASVWLALMADRSASLVLMTDRSASLHQRRD